MKNFFNPQNDIEYNENKIKKGTYDEMIDEAGGYGSYQQNVANIIMLCIVLASVLFYSMPYLLMMPDFNCYEKING